VSYQVIIAGVLVGTAVGVWMARTVKMTAMPQMVALLNGFGGAASLVVGSAEFLRAELVGSSVPLMSGVALQLALLIGAVTFSGSLIAFAKLQELISGRPITFPGLQGLNALGFLIVLGLSAYQIATAEPHLWPFYAVIGVSLILGVMLVIPI